MRDPLVSIIIPIHNAGKYLSETIQSALDQTWENKEIILVDDGSTDGSLSLSKSYKNPRIKVFSQENKGGSAARNKGLAEANGDYIQFLDADDLLGRDKIANQVRVLEINTGLVSITSTIHFKNVVGIDDAPSPYEESFSVDDNDPVHFLVNLWGGYSKYGSMVAVHSWLTPRNIIDKAGPWNEELALDDDGEFFCRVVLNSSGIVKTPGFNYYRKYDDSNSLSGRFNQKSLMDSLRSTLLKKKYLLERTDSYEAKLTIYKMLMYVLVRSYLDHPEIYKKAKNELPDINPGNYQPPMGGPRSDRLTQLLGWRTMLRLKQFYPKLKW